MQVPGSGNGGECVRACVLAGGRSSRMGQDKAALLFSGKTLLEVVCGTARAWGAPLSVIREDSVASCGPLGGVLTGFDRFEEERMLFLSCDMPFVSVDLMRSLNERDGTVFVGWKGRVGFPFIFSRKDLPIARRRFSSSEYSLQGLARECFAETVFSEDPEWELFNINTPEELEVARRMI